MNWLLGGYLWLFVHRPFEVWPSLGVLQIERAYMLVMLLAWLVAPGKGLVPNRVHLALGFFASSVGLCWVLSPYGNLPGVSVIVENFFKVAVFYVLFVTTVRDEKSLRTMLLAFLGVNALYIGHSLLEYLGGRHQYRMGTTRMTGVDVSFSDPNAFAATILYSLPLSLPFWFERPRRLSRWLLGGYAAMAAVSVLLTGSRSGFLGLCLTGLIFLWLSFRRKAALVVFGSLGFVLFAGVVTVALPAQLQDRYLTIVDPSRGPANAQESAEGRIHGLLNGIEAWHRSPIVGHGPGAFAAATGGHFGAHNIYGQVLSEMGLLGVVGLAGLLLALGLNWLEVRRHVRDNPALFPPGNLGVTTDFAYHASRGVTICIFLLFLMGFAGHNLYRYQWQWFAAFQAVALHCIRLRVAAARSGYAPLPDPAGPGPLPVLGPVAGW